MKPIHCAKCGDTIQAPMVAVPRKTIETLTHAKSLAEDRAADMEQILKARGIDVAVEIRALRPVPAPPAPWTGFIEPPVGGWSTYTAPPIEPGAPRTPLPIRPLFGV